MKAQRTKLDCRDRAALYALGFVLGALALAGLHHLAAWAAILV